MLDVEILDYAEVEKAEAIFHRDGVVVIENALTSQQLEFAQTGAAREVGLQMAALPLKEGNRGYARYSFEQHRIHLPEWSQLIDLPTVLPILDRIWGSSGYLCIGAGGDYSAPGAKIQPLHSDVGDFLRDPLKQTTVRDLPAPYIAVNFLMVDFKKINGAIRFIPSTQRSHASIPSLTEEPAWMRRSILCASAGSVIIRDVRCWHGGTANRSQEVRPMLDVVYVAPWFRQAQLKPFLPKLVYKTFSPRAKELCREIVTR
ncbi:MAG: phytanoyl-CoA dioxygenase family protein [candidate division Zixibacteria bacterium]|nr:phytanoyl-CoA dioxygenase family protein [candidate division Zixibacteria bacterium]